MAAGNIQLQFDAADIQKFVGHLCADGGCRASRSRPLAFFAASSPKAWMATFVSTKAGTVVKCVAIELAFVSGCHSIKQGKINRP